MKRALKVILIVLCLLILGLVGTGYLVTKSAWAQNKIAHYVTDKISDDLGVILSIEGLKVNPFTDFLIDGFYLEDQKGDTLLYIKTLTADISVFESGNKKLHFSKLTLDRPVINLHKHAGDSIENFQFVLDKYFVKDKDKESNQWDVSASAIEIIDGVIAKDDFNKRVIPTFDPNHLKLSNLNAYINEIEFEEGSILVNIEKLNFNERCGLKIKRLTAGLEVTPIDINYENLIVETSKSNLSLNGLLQYEKGAYFNNFIQEVIISASMNEGSYLNISDLGYFAEYLKESDEKIVLSGKIIGTIDRLKGKNLDLKFGDQSSFKGNVSFDGLPDLDRCFINFKVKKVVTNYNDFMYLDLPFIDNLHAILPSKVEKLGMMYFDGNFTGFIGDFVAYGNLYTNLGPIYSNVALTNTEGDGKYRIKGKVTTDEFNLRTYTGNEDLGRISANLEIDANGPDFKNLTAKIEGGISAFDYKGYDYQNLIINGLVDQDLFSGNLSGKEENLDFDFQGTIDLRDREPIYNFKLDVKKANLLELNLTDNKNFQYVQAELSADVVGNKIDDINGEAVVRKLVFYNGTDSLALDSFLVHAETFDDRSRSMRLRSSEIDIDINGTFKYDQLKKGVMSLLSDIMPAWYENEYIVDEDINLNFDVIFKKSNELLSMLLPEVAVSPGTTLNGMIDPTNKKFLVNGQSDSLRWKDIDLLGMKFTSERYDDRAYVMFENTETNVSEKINFTENIFTAIMYNDSLESDLTWRNKGLNTSGFFSTFAVFESPTKGNLEFLPSVINVNNENWEIANSYNIQFDGKEFNVDNFILEKGEEKLVLDGEISTDPEKVLTLRFDDFQLNHLNSFVNSEKFSVDGMVNAHASVKDVYKDIAIESELDVQDIFLMGESIGNLNASSKWDKNKNLINVLGGLTKGDKKVFDLQGNYKPKEETNKLNATLKVDELNLSLLDLINASGISNYQGKASGEVNITGQFSEPILIGDLYLENAGVKIDYLNTTYIFSDTVHIDNDWMGIDVTEVRDKYGNIAIVNGTVIHENYRKWNYDFDAVFENLLCFDLQQGMNELFYGIGYAKGNASISGYNNALIVEVNAKSNRGTNVNVPLGEEGEVRLENFVTFTSPVKKKELKADIPFEKIITLNLDVTRDAFVRLIFDEKIGDIMEGRGNGLITMELDPRGDFYMIGNYTVEEGDYLFTLKNIVNKKFEVERGGTIKWFGDPLEALIDLTAIYKVRASLSEFATEFPEITQRNVMTHCEMKLDRRLLNPDIEFKIEFPNLDPNTRNLISNKVNSELELNRQFFSLLVLNKFLSSQNTANENGFNAVGAGVNTGVEFLANQLSNWLSQISKDFDVGVNYRPGDQISNQELAVALSTQLFNERLQITGNLGVSEANEYNGSKTSLIGDFILEYMLTPEGRFRLKVFNETNDFNLVNTNQTGSKQGIGIVFHKDIDPLLD